MRSGEGTWGEQPARRGCGGRGQQPAVLDVPTWKNGNGDGGDARETGRRGCGDGDAEVRLPPAAVRRGCLGAWDSGEKKMKLDRGEKKIEAGLGKLSEGKRGVDFFYLLQV